MNGLKDKIGSAFITIIFTALLAGAAMLIKHDGKIELILYRLEMLEKDVEKLEEKEDD